jgi:hypothetical protein
VLAAATALLAAWLGAIQLASSAVLRGDAVPGSWIRLIPEGVTERVARLGPRWPLPPALRLVLARQALAGGDLALAQRDIGSLPPSPDRLALQGSLAAAHGDAALAVRDELAAGDLTALERVADDLRARGDVAGARSLLEAVVRRLQGDPTQADALAEADYQLGLLDEERAIAYPAGTAARRRFEAASRDDYAQAAALAPLAERYAIAYGNQLINLSDFAAAVAVFTRAGQAHPTSALPLAGLSDVAFRRGNAPAARALYERARALDPDAPAILRLRREVGATN